MPGLPPFEGTVREHGPVVLRVCRAILGSGADADDAWQETFLAALRGYPTLEAGTNLQAWLVTVAHHKAVDVLRAQRRQPAPVPGSPEATGVDEADRSVSALALRTAVAGLPERQRLAVALHHLGGLPYAEVAALVGGTPEAARRAASDGIAALRRAGLEP